MSVVGIPRVPERPEPRVLVAAALAALAVGALLGLGVELIVVVPLALVALPVLALRPHLSITALSLWVPLQYWLTKDLAILPRGCVWLDEAILVVLTCVLVVRQLSLRTYRWTPLDVPVILFVAVAAASAITNGVRPIVGVLGLRDILQFVIVFYALALLPLDARWDRRWILLAFAIGLFQAPLAAFQTRAFFTNEAARVAQGDYDIMIGTFGPGGGDFVAYFVMFLLLLLFGRVRSGRTRLLWIVPALLTTFVFSTSRLCFLFLPLGLGWLYRSHVRRDPRTLVAPLAFAGVLVLGLVIYYWNDPKIMRMVLDPTKIVSSQFAVDEHYAGRMIHYPIAWMILRDIAVSPLLGVGPGMYLGPTASFFMVPVTQMFYDMFNLNPAELRFGSVDSGFLEILVPYGLIGLAAFTFLVSRLHAIGHAVERNARSGAARDLGASFRAIVVFMIVGSLAAPVWEVQILAFYFWLFAGITYRAGRREGVFA